MEQNNRGGKRDGAGRKPIDNPKETVSLFVEKKTIWLFGNKEKLKERLYGSIKTMVQDLNKPTNEIKPFEQHQTNYVASVPTQKEAVIIGSIEAYKQEILATTNKEEIEMVMSKIQAASLNSRVKQTLENIAKVHSKDFFND